MADHSHHPASPPAAAASTPSPFVHLHVHTHYSMLDGACRISDLVKRTKALGMDALAITDHGCMFGVIEFFNECKKEGIKPILGMEAYVAPGSRHERTSASGTGSDAAYHLLMLAQDMEGYRNLVKLSSLAYREGFYYKPRVDKELLRQYSKGLIATSACLGGEVASAIMKHDLKKGRALAEEYLQIFGPERFFIEVQSQGVDVQEQVNPELVEIAKKIGAGLVATNDVHYLNRDDYEAHDVLCCISMGRLVSDENRLKYPTEIYLKSPAEMQQRLGKYDQAIENTRRIADMCKLELDFSKRYAPVYRVPAEKLKGEKLTGEAPVGGITPVKDDERYLRQLCEEGLEWRYGTKDVSAAVRERLEYELKVICAKNFCSYFLIVWDFCNYARDNGIPVGARGSGVGTMVGYLLGLCNVDPITYGLLFERFMDPSRSEMPDIDIDICQDGRAKVIEYVRQKYGHVAQIITFGTLAAKAVCKDVGRVLGVTLAEVDRITKLIPGTPGTTLKKALEQVPELRELYNTTPQVKKVIDIGQRLEGLCRNAGCHAAGVIIADQALDDIVPLYKDNVDNILTQFEGPVAEKVGLLKMDFLGLRTLSVVTRAVELVKKNKGIVVDIEKIDFTDKKVLELFCRGETKGVFQFESGGMQDLLMKMKPDRLEDLIAANALYRPGPMELIPTYCGRKHGREKVPSVHPIMDELLKETYGIMCIHEDARIALANGTEKPIREIRRGDMVHSVDRTTQRVVARECHGCGPTRFGPGVRVTLENGFAVTLTEDHKVFTFDGMKEAGSLDPSTDLVMVPRHARREGPAARHLAPWLGADVDVAYLLGSLIGDGCLTSSGTTIATGNEPDHRKFVAFVRERLPSLHVHEYFHGRCWYVSLSHPELAGLAAPRNRKTRLGLWLEQLGLRAKASRKRVPSIVFQTGSKVRAAFLAGLLDADGCTKLNAKGAQICFLTSTSRELLEDVRRLAQLEGVPVTIRPNRIQFWNCARLKDLLSPYLLVRSFDGECTNGLSVGWVPREAIVEAVRQGESGRAFTARTGVQRTGLRSDFPFAKSITASKSGVELGDLRYFRIARVERVENQQFYGMSVAEHHNLVANGVVIKNCYQEQVMQVFNQLGGIELANAYKLIKAISKKTIDVIAKFKPEFIKGTMAKGVSQSKAEELFELILKFGGYGFNKSHSTRYAIVAFQTAFLKTYHPVEYMAALLTYEMGSTEKVVEYIDECRRVVLGDGSRGIKVLPPDVNVSDKDFTPVYVEEKGGKGRQKKQGVIRFGLCAVKGIGEKLVEEIMVARGKGIEFANLHEFCERCDVRTVQKSSIELLIKCGAFGSMKAKRAALLAGLDGAFEAAQRAQEDKRAGQMSMFGAPAAAAAAAAGPSPGLPDVPEFPPSELLRFEKELLGFYITSHPLTEHQAKVENFSTFTTREALAAGEGTEVMIGAMISAVKAKVAKSGRSMGQKWAIVEFEDFEGKIEGMCFAETFADISGRHPEVFKSDQIVFVKGKVDRKRETPSLMVNDIIPVKEAVAKLTTALGVKLDRTRHPAGVVEEIKAVAKKHAGKKEWFLLVPTGVGGGVAGAVGGGGGGKTVTIKMGGEAGVRITSDLVEDLERVLGSGSVQLRGEATEKRKRMEQRRLFAEAQLAAGAPEPQSVAVADAGEIGPDDDEAARDAAAAEFAMAGG